MMIETMVISEGNTCSFKVTQAASSLQNIETRTELGWVQTSKRLPSRAGHHQIEGGPFVEGADEADEAKMTSARH